MKASTVDAMSPYTKGAYLTQAYYGWVAAYFYTAKMKDKTPERQAARVLEDAIKMQSASMAVFFIRIRSSRRTGKAVPPTIEKSFWAWMADRGLDRSVV